MLQTASSLQPLACFHRIIGIGNAGGNFLDRLLVNDPTFSGLIAINNDAEALAASVVPAQLVLSADLEPTAALAEMTSRLEEEIAGASVVILCGGLGGRTASMLLPEIAKKSKALKKLTLACVTYPFSFEGKRIQSIAAESLSVLKSVCDGVILLDNNALCSANAAAFGDTFAASDEALQVYLPALLAMLMNKGPVRIARASLLAALSRLGVKTYFGYGQASGANRLHEAMERVIKSPLLDRGRVLTKASTIFMLLRGPKDLSFAEAQAAMQAVERVAGERADIQLSVNAEEPSGAPLQIFILATVESNEKSTLSPQNLSSQSTAAVTGFVAPVQGASQQAKLKDEVRSGVSSEKSNASTLTSDLNCREATCAPSTPDPSSAAATLKTGSPSAEVVSAVKKIEPSHDVLPSSIEEKPKREVPFNIASKDLLPKQDETTKVISVMKPTLVAKPKQTQGALNFTAAQRGRFDKSEPTIVEGEDLDTPTYLRLGLKLS